jgi:hypothetical protein
MVKCNKLISHQSALAGCTAKDVTTFVINALVFMIIALVFTRQHVNLRMKRVLTTAVAQSVNLKLWVFIAAGQAEIAPCAAVFPVHGYLPAGNHLLCFLMSTFPLPVYILLFSHGSQYLTTLHVRCKVYIPHFHLVL